MFMDRDAVVQLTEQYRMTFWHYCWSHWSQLFVAGTQGETQSQWSKLGSKNTLCLMSGVEKRCYNTPPSLPSEGLLVLCIADGCQQLCNDIRVKVSVDWPDQSAQRYGERTPASFRMHKDEEAKVVEVAATVRWRKGLSKAPVLWDLLIAQLLASAVKASRTSSYASWRATRLWSIPKYSIALHSSFFKRMLRY